VTASALTEAVAAFHHRETTDTPTRASARITKHGGAMSTLNQEWRPARVGSGVSVKLLRRDVETGAVTVVFVVEGEVRIGKDRLGQGDYLYTDPDGVHAVSSESGATILVVLPKPVEILEKGAPA
jgi:hypothetical protein